jgi:nucleoside-diphosphate-sugar epimerase
LRVATDLSIDAEMFNWAINTGQTKIIYYSSSAAYPISRQTAKIAYKLKESDIDLSKIRNPDFTYGWSKLTGEMLAQHASKHGVKTYIFRPFSGYGEDQDLTYPFPSFVDRIRKRVNTFEIWGDGSQVRDFIYIDDIVEATMKAVELDILEPLNLGTGIPISFVELAEMMFKISGFRPINGIKLLTDKPVGVMYRCCNPKKLKTFYKMQYSLEQVIERIFSENK